MNRDPQGGRSSTLRRRPGPPRRSWRLRWSPHSLWSIAVLLAAACTKADRHDRGEKRTNDDRKGNVQENDKGHGIKAGPARRAPRVTCTRSAPNWPGDQRR